MTRGEAEAVAVSILAKVPIPGHVKTRLIPALGAHGAAALHAHFIERTIQTAGAAGIGPVVLWTFSEDGTTELFASVAGRVQAVRPQPEGDLGARMFAALAEAGGPAIVIGTDCPALSPEHLRIAADILRSGIDAVVIPVEDGGYSLIGTRRPDTSLFEDVPWSTSDVMTETRRRLARLGWSWREPARLWDVDVPRDIKRLETLGTGAPPVRLSP